MLPWPVWPLAGQSGLGQNTVARSMSILLALSSGLPRVWLDLRFCYKSASPRFSAELPAHLFLTHTPRFLRFPLGGFQLQGDLVPLLEVLDRIRGEVDLRGALCRLQLD